MARVSQNTGSGAPTWTINPQPISAAAACCVAMNAGWSQTDAVVACAIAIAESSLNCAAISPLASDNSRGYGAWQIEYPTHASLFPGGSPQNPSWIYAENNANMAYSVYTSQGWHAWTTYQTGAAQANLPQATIGMAQLQNDALAAKQTLQEYVAAQTKIISADQTPAIGAIDLGGDLGSAIITGAQSAGEAGGAFTSLYQGYTGSEAGNPLLRVVEILLGSALLLIGLSKIAAPITAPVAGAVKTATKIIPV